MELLARFVQKTWNLDALPALRPRFANKTALDGVSPFFPSHTPLYRYTQQTTPDSRCRSYRFRPPPPLHPCPRRLVPCLPSHPSPAEPCVEPTVWSCCSPQYATRLRQQSHVFSRQGVSLTPTPSPHLPWCPTASTLSIPTTCPWLNGKDPDGLVGAAPSAFLALAQLPHSCSLVIRGIDQHRPATFHMLIDFTLQR